RSAASLTSNHQWRTFGNIAALVLSTTEDPFFFKHCATPPRRHSGQRAAQTPLGLLNAIPIRLSRCCAASAPVEAERVKQNSTPNLGSLSPSQINWILEWPAHR